MHSSGDQDRIVAALDRLHVELPSWGFSNTGDALREVPAAGRGGHDGRKDQRRGSRPRADRMLSDRRAACPVGLSARPGRHRSRRGRRAAQGLRPGAINPNLFQDQEYKHGSFGNPSAAVRERALAHCRDSIAIAQRLGSRDISLWFADGSNYPGTANIRARKRWIEEGLAALHAVLGPEQRLLVEYKPFEPAFYHTDVADWGMALLMARAAGPQAKVLVDTGHHYLSQNIEQIVAWLLAEGMLGGFHFNDRRYADDDLTLGSIDPYQVFRIFHEINVFEWETGARADVAFVVDQSHNLKGKIESMIQTVVQAQSLVAKAALVDGAALAAAQQATDLVRAESCLQDAFAIDVRPIVREWRSARGRPIDPMQAFREGGYLERITKERAGRPMKDPSAYA
jgi:L-rhamnose isomerase/sugar isomerase